MEMKKENGKAIHFSLPSFHVWYLFLEYCDLYHLCIRVDRTALRSDNGEILPRLRLSVPFLRCLGRAVVKPA
jgi:hypothetical protein